MPSADFEAYSTSLGLDPRHMRAVPPEPDQRYPLLVFVVPESVVPLRAQIERTGIVLMVVEEKLTLDTERSEAYWIRIDTSRNRGIRPSEVVFSEGERGLTLAEGIALAAQYPDMLRERSFDLLGSGYGSECTPTIYAWEGRVMLSAICSDVSDAMCGAPTTID